MRAIAFDIGTKRVGVAVSDALGISASPVTVVSRSDDAGADAQRLVEMAQDYRADPIVVGMPVSLRGDKQIAARYVEAFIELLREPTETPVVAWDERMTTVIAERAMIEGDASRGKRRKKVDQVAAAVLLQSYLAAQGGPRQEEGAGDEARDG